MKRALIVLGLVAVGATVSLTLCASRYEARVRPNVEVGPVKIGGLTRDGAKKKIREWWESTKQHPLYGRVERGSLGPIEFTSSKAGFVIDDEACLANVPLEDFWGAAGRFFNRAEEATHQFEIQLKPNGANIDFLNTYVKASMGEAKPARVTYENGAVMRIPEVSGCELDREALEPVIVAAVRGNGQVVLPIREAPKQVPDSELEKITGIVGEFTTNFRTSQISRNANLKLASGKLDGAIIMPGETFSMNGTLGRRTIEQGYKLAGVYKNGKHDLGIGGGICQVSGTLYNAVLMSNLKIVERHNHSMPVPYLAVGRDATVDYGSFDLKFANPYDFPIAVSTTFGKGKLTFRILGVPDPNMQIKIITTGHRSWSRGTQFVNDPNLPAGKEKVIEKGCAGHSISTYRIVMKDGVEVARELLSNSRYAGGVRIVARNTKAAASPPPNGASPISLPQGSPTPKPATAGSGAGVQRTGN